MIGRYRRWSRAMNDRARRRLASAIAAGLRGALVAAFAVPYALSYGASFILRNAVNIALWIAAAAELGWSDAWPRESSPRRTLGRPRPPRHVRRVG